MCLLANNNSSYCTSWSWDDKQAICCQHVLDQWFITRECQGSSRGAWASLWDNTKQRPGGLCSQMKNMNFPRAGELHRRAGRQDRCTTGQTSGLHSKLGCRKGRLEGCHFLQPAPPFFAAHWTVFLCSPPFCLLKVHVFHLETRPSSSPGLPISVILAYVPYSMKIWWINVPMNTLHVTFGFEAYSKSGDMKQRTIT